MTTITGAVRHQSTRLGSVLIVDDSTDTRLIAGMVLESAGYTTSEAASGSEALRLLADGLPPDVVLLDLNMPGMGGFTVLRRLAEEHPDLPVVVFTADLEGADWVRRQPGQHVVVKPFIPARLVSVIGAVVAR